MRRFLWLALGVVLLGGGLVLALTAPSAMETDFGWFAYTPLEDDADWYMEWSDPGYIVSRGLLAGVAVAGLGVLVLATGIAYRLGRRQRPAS